MKKTLLYMSFMLLLQACGTVDRKGIYDEISSVEYKQLQHKEEWVKNISIKGFTSDSMRDKDGNFYFVSTDIGNFRLTKLDADSNEIWTKKYETENDNFHAFIAQDKDKNIFIAGNSSSDFVNFEDYEIVSMKVSPEGELLWSKIDKTDKSDLVYDVQTDSNGNFYIVGGLNGNTASKDDSFITKYSTNGTKEWSKIVNTSYYTNTHSIEIDKQNNIYVSGITGRDIFFAKYLPDGTQTHYEEFKTSDDERSIHMSLGLDGYLYIGGKLVQKDENGEYLEENAHKLFIKKLNKSGEEKYFTIFDNSPEANEYISTLNSDIYGNLYAFGEYLEGDASNNTISLFLTQFNPDGDILYKKEYDGHAYLGSLGTGNDLYIDTNNSIYVSSMGYLKLNGNESQMGNFILKLSPTN